MSLREDIKRLAHQMEGEDNAAYNLWTWLPSHAAAQKAHGDHAGNYKPSVLEVMNEACEFISHRLHPTPQEREEAGELYVCPCGDDHEDSVDEADSGQAGSPTTVDEFAVRMRTDIERFAKFWRQKNRADPGNYPASFEQAQGGKWFEQFRAFVDQEQEGASK